MNYKLLHIFRNTPLGRETFLQSLYFCKMINAFPVVYIPRSDKFLFYFANDAVQIDLDASYLTSPDTARPHTEALFDEMGISPMFYEPKNYTASSLPDIATTYDYFACPRSVSDLSSKIGLGHIGPKVRRIVKHAAFPVLMTSTAFKPWKSVTVFFGGSKNAFTALKSGLKIAKASGMPLDLFTLKESGDEAYYKDLVRGEKGLETIQDTIRQWRFFDKSDFDTMLYEVPHDALVVAGAFGHGVIKDILLGSKIERIQSTLTNNMLITGPHCSLPI